MVESNFRRTAVIFTALPVESKAVLAQMTSDDGDEMVESQVFELRKLTQPDGTVWRVAVVELGPGNIDTAALVVPAARRFEPDVMMFVGIAGALKADVEVGDVVAGASVSWTERAKETDQQRLDRIQTAHASKTITSLARKAARTGDWISRRKEPETGRPNLTAVVGQLASGEEVVAGGSRKRVLQLVHSDAIAIENEGFGFTRTATGTVDEYIVIRGICDNADGSKNDSAHQTASDSAAAFAVELISLLNSVLNVSQSPSHTTKAVTIAKEHGHDSASSIVRDLITDEDLIGDDEAEVLEVTQVFLKRSDGEMVGALVELATALDSGVNPQIERRLEWFTRALIKWRPDLLGSPDLDSLARDHGRGAAQALMEPAVWPDAPDRLRRRLLSALLGSSSSPRAPDAAAMRLLLPLVRGAALSAAEYQRLEASLRQADYWELYASGVPIDLLVTRMLDDLDSGDFSRQNPAARFLYQTEESTQASTDLDPMQDIKLGAALVDAAPEIYPANGAKEALNRSRLIGWSVNRLAGAVWAGVTSSDRRDLKWDMSVRLPNVIAAAVAKDELARVLETVRGLVQDSVSGISDGSTADGVLLESLEDLEVSLEGGDRQALSDFRSWLAELADGNP